MHVIGLIFLLILCCLSFCGSFKFMLSWFKLSLSCVWLSNGCSWLKLSFFLLYGFVCLFAQLCLIYGSLCLLVKGR